MEKEQYFNGLKFTRDDKTGYYLNSTIGKRMHRYVWEHYNGKIPEGMHIHHINHNKSDNDINNLMLINQSEHATYHGNLRAEKDYEKMIENLNKNARPKASEWHKSEKGRKWHKKHYEKTKDKLHKKEKAKCENCGKTYITVNVGSNRFCSNKCKSAWRRKSGVDDETRICEMCGKEFRTNKYSKAKCCSKSCGAKKGHRNKSK